MVTQSEAPQVEFLSRVANIPVVHSAMEYASSAYEKAKDLSPKLVKKTLSTAEDTVSYAARMALPVVTSLEGPIHVVDSLACKTLDKVEETLPVMTKTPEEIVTSTRSYVNNKLHDGASSAVSIVSTATNSLLNNPIGRLALNSLELTVSTVHDYIDFFIPPEADEDKDKSPKIDTQPPTEPCQKIMWSVKRTTEAVFKVQHRLSSRSQHILHQIGLSGLIAVGSLVNLLEWIQSNWKELMVEGMSVKLHKLANYYRGSTDSVDDSSRSINTMEDFTFLAGYFAKRCAEFIRSALDLIKDFFDSPGVAALRVQLKIALVRTLDFTSRIFRILSSKDVVENANQFLKTDFPLIHKALTMAKSMTFDSKVKVRTA